MRTMMQRLAIVALFLSTIGGCSSMPRKPQPDTELNTRTSSLHKLGRQHYQAGRLDKAEAYFDQALKTHAEVDDQAGVALCFLSKGRVHLARGESEKAIAAFNQAALSAENLKRPDLIAQTRCGLAAVEMKNENPSGALAILEAALTLPLPENSRENAVLNHDLGSALLQLNNPTGAMPRLLESQRIHTTNKDRQGLATTSYSLALAHEQTGNLSAAITAATQALTHDKAVFNSRGVHQDLVLLESLHRKNGDPTRAAIYHRRLLLLIQTGS